LKATDPNQLCLECGFCCNGVIFADVKLQRGDDAASLTSLGIRISGGRFRQPCSAWKDCRCQIYSDRPKYCRQFECLLLQSLRGGEVEYPAALETVRVAQNKANEVRRLLGELGDGDEQLNLRKRFQRTTKRIEAAESNRERAALYSELTLAFHELDQMLRGSFYDG